MKIGWERQSITRKVKEKNGDGGIALCLLCFTQKKTFTKNSYDVPQLYVIYKWRIFNQLLQY